MFNRLSLGWKDRPSLRLVIGSEEEINSRAEDLRHTWRAGKRLQRLDPFNRKRSSSKCNHDSAYDPITSRRLSLGLPPVIDSSTFTLAASPTHSSLFQQNPAHSTSSPDLSSSITYRPWSLSQSQSQSQSDSSTLTAHSQAMTLGDDGQLVYEGESTIIVDSADAVEDSDVAKLVDVLRTPSPRALPTVNATPPSPLRARSKPQIRRSISLEERDLNATSNDTSATVSRTLQQKHDSSDSIPFPSTTAPVRYSPPSRALPPLPSQSSPFQLKRTSTAPVRFSSPSSSSSASPKQTSLLLSTPSPDPSQTSFESADDASSPSLMPTWETSFEVRTIRVRRDSTERREGSGSATDQMSLPLPRVQSFNSVDSTLSDPTWRNIAVEPKSVSIVVADRPSRSNARSRLYGERRMSETTVNVMTVVEEDDSPEGSRYLRSRSRYSQPAFVANSTQSDEMSAHFILRQHRVHSLTGLSNSSSASLLLDRASELRLPQPRHRYSSDFISRPPLVLTRSLSLTRSPASVRMSGREARRTAPAISIDTELSRSFRPTSRSARQEDDSNYSTPLDPIALSALLPQVSVNHQRWNSELTTIGSEEGGGARSRKHSLASPGRVEAEERRNTRTRLVLREEGKAPLTYQLGECIGRGQFGSVYRALNLTNGRVVAIKRIGLDGLSDSEILHLSNEIELLKDLSHPSIVSYEGVIRTENYVNIVLEFIENGSLHKTLKHFGELPEGLIASYCVKILEGLDYLHSKGVVHCDLKCANILSTKNGNVKLSDFGVSLNLNAVRNFTAKKTSDVNGTPNWMAPEVIKMQGASKASDIWSLGCTLIELVDSKPPYSGLNTMAAMYRIVSDDDVPIPLRCSPELTDFLKLCFAKDPLLRPSAVTLFEHAWLKNNWNPYQDLRAQDSIPFLRRISTSRGNSILDTFAMSPISISSPGVGTVDSPHSDVECKECQVCHAYGLARSPTSLSSKFQFKLHGIFRSSKKLTTTPSHDTARSVIEGIRTRRSVSVDVSVPSSDSPSSFAPPPHSFSPLPQSPSKLYKRRSKRAVQPQLENSSSDCLIS